MPKRTKFGTALLEGLQEATAWKRGEVALETVNIRRPIHPGEILREEFLAPLGMTAGTLARALHVPRTRMERLVREEVSLSADTALRLSRYFGTSAEMWMNLQVRYGIEMARDASGADIEAIEPSPDAAKRAADGEAA